MEEAISSVFLPSPATLFRVYSLEDMLARKLTALYRRAEGKDMYDVFHMSNFSSLGSAQMSF